MRKFKMRCALVLLCSAVAFGWATDKSRQKDDKERQHEHGQNRGIVQQVFDEVVNKGDFERVNQIYAPNCVIHHNNQTMGLNEAVKDAREWRAAAPDTTMTVEKIDGEKDRLTVHWIARGTNTGAGHGLTASGKKFMVRGHTGFRIANGKIVEEWNDFNEEEIFKQLGQTPKKR